MVEIKEPGKYRVVAHVPESLYATFLGSFLKNARLYYQVFSEEGDTYVELDLNEETPGWIELGTYEFREGEKLTCKTRTLSAVCRKYTGQ